MSITGIKGTMKIPERVIIAQLKDEIRILKEKNHAIVEKAKEREEHWKAYTDELLSTIAKIDNDESEERRLRREVRAIKKMNSDYKLLLDTNNHLVRKSECLKQQIEALKSEVEGKPVGQTKLQRAEIRNRFAKLKNRREIMDNMLFPYNEAMPIAYNSIVFLEWVRTNAKWEELYTLMYGG